MERTLTSPTALLLTVAAALLIACDRSPSTSTTTARLSSSNSTPTAQQAPWFEEQASQRGVNFTWRSGHQPDKYLFPESIGGGAALFDMDNDGDLDAYLVQAGSLSDTTSNPPDTLLRNRGDGTFEDVSPAINADTRAYGMGIAAGDYDNDSDIDLYVTNVGPNILLRNNGDSTFADATTSANVGHPGWSSSAAFLDYDNDHDLDLYVCQYINWSISTELDCFNNMGAPDYCSPNNYSAPAMDVLYRNNGPPDYNFTDVTIEAGLDAYVGNSLGVVCCDFNRDGFSDVFVANDGMRNQLWANQKNGTFVEVGLQTSCALDLEGKAKAGMGVDANDIDDDGDIDIIVCNLKRESDSVFIHQGTHFNDETTRAGLRVLTRAFTRFGIGWIDFDNDGYLDLYQANGLVMREDTQYSDDPYAQPNLLFRGKPGAGGVFEEVQPRGGTAHLLVATSRAAVFGDIDNDGAIDILVINRDGPAHLLHNITADPSKPDAQNPKSKNSGVQNPKLHHWIMLRILDQHNCDAYGAVLTIKLGQRTLTRPLRAAYSYLASNDPRIHLGLGDSTQIDSLTIRYPDGATESLGPLPANQIHTIQRNTPDAPAKQ
ncbi:MAG: CRTAC1 family protein [Phycisphaerales bacterium]|nr:CRTAC1 family protein [Phycisphaerales bacterium]